jgi:hypothetical protein
LTVATRQNRTLIDTLSAGYGAVNRRLWVLLLPIVASLYFAYGQPVSLAPILQQTRGALATLPSAERESASEAITLLTLLEGVDMRLPLLRLNYLPLLSTAIGAAGPDAVVLRTPGQLLAALALINGAALLLGALYLQQLAGVVAPAPAQRAWRPGDWARLVGSLGLWALLVMLVGVGVGLPYILLGALVSAVVPPALPLVVLAFLFVVFWAGVYVGFSAEAMALDGVGPLRASLRSISLVRRNFLPTVGLLLLVWLISAGLGFVWRQLGVGPIGLALACVASAYVGSGLAAARMLYYRERSSPA